MYPILHPPRQKKLVFTQLPSPPHVSGHLYWHPGPAYPDMQIFKPKLFEFFSLLNVYCNLVYGQEYHIGVEGISYGFVNQPTP